MKNWKYINGAEGIKVGNASKSEIIEKKKKEGATLKVDNGQKLEFSDGSTYVKTSFSDDYREAHNYVGNAEAQELEKDVEKKDKEKDEEVEKLETENKAAFIKQPGTYKYVPVEEGFSYQFEGKVLQVTEINGTDVKLSDGRTIKSGPSGEEMKVTGNSKPTNNLDRAFNAMAKNKN